MLVTPQHNSWKVLPKFGALAVKRGALWMSKTRSRVNRQPRAFPCLRDVRLERLPPGDFEKLVPSIDRDLEHRWDVSSQLSRPWWSPRGARGGGWPEV